MKIEIIDKHARPHATIKTNDTEWIRFFDELRTCALMQEGSLIIEQDGKPFEIPLTIID